MSGGDLNQPRVSQCPERPLLLYGPQTAGGYSDADGFLQFRYENRLCLQVRIAPNGAAWVELRGAGTVGIAAAGDGSSLGYIADFGHRNIMLS